MTQQGTIKNFLSTKGFGFITCPDVEGDVYFQRRDLPEDLQVNVSEDIFSLKGLSCTFEPNITKDGKTQGRSVKVMGGDGFNLLGVIKNFNPMKGYGFISSPLLEGDLYFKGKELPPQLAASDVRGMKVRAVAAAMQDGKMQARDVIVLNAVQPGAAQGPMGRGAPMPMPPSAAPGMGLGQPQVAAPPPQVRNGGMAAPRSPAGNAPPAASPLGHTIPEGTSMVGAVKTFDPAKGYGFIEAPNFPVDIYFKPDAEMVLPGQPVTFTVHFTREGKPQAREVTSPMQAGEVYTGTVRRYSPKTGYGFLSVDGRSQDVYFQKKDLPMQLQESGALDGAQFNFSVVMSAMNKPQAQDMECVAMPTQGMKRPAPTQAPQRGPAGPAAMQSPVLSNPAKRLRPTATAGPAAAQAMANQMANPMVNAFGGGIDLAAVSQIMQAAAAGIPGMAGALGTGFGAADQSLDGKSMGSVKSFNPAKGFGFIASPTLPSDVYFNAKSLPEEYRGMQLAGQQVAFTVRYTQDGKLQGNDVQVMM
mmetsp:Transcript_19763/g.46078  ORF Transcript_19763/g.46078 Transcript_19763/m.46078 type:complete len:530 (+) Transcript_19763:99-1688(+)